MNGYEITSQNYFSQFSKWSQSVRRSSLCEARQKVDWRAFQYLLEKANQEAHPDLQSLRWKGHWVKAIDGTFLTLPATRAILERFPRRPNPQSLAHYPYALLVSITNVLTGQPVALELQDHSGSERKALAKLVERGVALRPNDVLLMDRGFEGVEYWKKIYDANVFFVARIRAQGNLSKEIREFIHSDSPEKIIDLNRKTAEGGVYVQRVRLIRGKKDRLGVPILLATNLLCKAQYAADEVTQLYLKRWSIETMYFQVKELFHLEKFHAKSVNGILQEVFAHFVILSLTSLLTQEARLRTQPQELKKIPNLKAASEVVRRNFPIWVHKPLSLSESISIAHQLFEQVRRIHCLRQVGRTNPRVSKQPNSSWHRGRKDRPKLKTEARLRINREKRRP